MEEKKNELINKINKIKNPKIIDYLVELVDSFIKRWDI